MSSKLCLPNPSIVASPAHPSGACATTVFHLRLVVNQPPKVYVAALRSVFAEAWRIMRSDGTLWLNLRHTYASAWPCDRRKLLGNGSMADGLRKFRPPRLAPGPKEKDLVGSPWAVVFALRADGWLLRGDIVWQKPNPMPKSVDGRRRAFCRKRAIWPAGA